jgi:hypothetical protein
MEAKYQILQNWRGHYIICDMDGNNVVSEAAQFDSIEAAEAVLGKMVKPDVRKALYDVAGARIIEAAVADQK